MIEGSDIHCISNLSRNYDGGSGGIEESNGLLDVFIIVAKEEEAWD